MEPNWPSKPMATSPSPPGVTASDALPRPAAGTVAASQLTVGTGFGVVLAGSSVGSWVPDGLAGAEDGVVHPAARTLAMRRTRRARFIGPSMTSSTVPQWCRSCAAEGPQ